ncbi:MAG: hypothetical protein IJV17_02225 [Prevotella sp.]|nr:hypothetical protein [Prevotella sp.]
MKKLALSTMMLGLVMTVSAQNPYLPLWEHVPDGEPRVFEDPDHPGKMRAYIIGSHDTHYKEYCGNDIRMWSAPVEDLSQWRDEGPIFSWYVNGRWDTMFAPDLVEVKDRQTGKKTYWLYPHSRGWQRVPMVCKSDRPNGPFVPVNLTADGTKCLEGSLIDFDPSVFIEPVTNKKDPDFDKGYRAYVYYGFQHSSAFELDQQTMYLKREGREVLDGFIPDDMYFFEASSIRQIGNKYVMIYSGFSGPEYGLGRSNSTLRYAFGDTPLGPWTSGGVLVDSRGVVPNEDGSHLTTTNAGHNTHGSLQEINGQWYVFYHRPPRGFGYARQAMVAPVKITWDKKAVAKGGQVRITGYDPYLQDNEWIAKATDGSVYAGAEVTSEGFQIYGLPPYHYYSAGIACYMTNNQWMQDNHDVWNNHMDLTGIPDKGIVGFKYFGFGGLAADTKGLKAFQGTQQGDDTHLNLNLTPCGQGAFKIHIMLDGPYDNTVWNGKEIAVLNIPADAPRTAKSWQVAVPAVEGLTGKHAIYLVVEGPEAEKGLLDLHGIGFSKTGMPCERPIVPTVSIYADGKRLDIPTTPLFCTNANGYMEMNHYQVYAPLKEDSKIQVVTSDPTIQVTVSNISDGRATVRCVYNGKEKIFLIN